MNNMKKKTSGNCSSRKIFIYRMLIMALLSLATLALAGSFSGGIKGGTTEDPGVLTTGDKWATVGMFCFDEQVVTAPNRGSADRVIPQGQKAARGEAVVNLKTAATDLTQDDKIIALTAPEPGLISYYFDGLESVVTPDTIEEISIKALLKSDNTETFSEETGFYRKGQAVFKTINNHKAPLLCLNIPANLLYNQGELGDKWQLTVNGEDVTAVIYSCLVEGNSYSLIFSLPAEDKWFARRFVPVIIRDLQ